MNFNPSAITDLNKAIENFNPFDRSLVVRSHDVWEQHFPDVPSINAHVSNALFQGIEQIRKGQRSVLGITIRAEKGLGKSHLISRIRHRIRDEKASFFVYMSETDYGDLDQINSQFLNTLAFSLKQAGNYEVMQWQELATALVNQIYKTNHPPQQIVNRFPGALTKNPKLVDDLTIKACQIKPDIKDPYVLQAILWTLCPAKSLFAINWLAGRELNQTQADAMGLPNPREEDREARALSIASQVLDLIGDYKTIVICFDEVEPKSCNSQGLTTPQVVSLLAKDIYSKIKRGILIMAIFPLTWKGQVTKMPMSESVVDRIGEKIFDLKNLNSDDVVNLVTHWLKDFYSSKELTPPEPVYPFDEDELRNLGKEKPIVRKVLQWCYENWKVPGKETSLPLPSDPLHQVEVAFNEQLKVLEEKISDYLENSTLIASALRLSFSGLEGKSIGQVKIEHIEDITTRAADKGYLHFRIVGEDNGKLTKIVVSVVQESGAKYVSAALSRLIDYKKFDMTRGCLVRSKAVKPKTKGQEHLDQLLSKQGGEWVLLKAEDIKPLLAILFVYQACQDYEIEEIQVFEFIKQKQIAENNYLICEILSDPSGQVPNDAVDEDIEVIRQEEISNPNKKNSKSIDELLVALNS